MAASSGITEGELSEICFNDETWIRRWGLSPHNVLDYFACSPFYDPKCNNEIIRRQGADITNLLSKKGLEYNTLKTGHEPLLFVVVKQERFSEKRVQRLALYYILDKTIYQAPTLQKLIVSRLAKSSCHLQNAFNILYKASRYTPSEGFTWHFEDDAFKDWKQSSEGMQYERRRKLRDEKLERTGENEISSILNNIAQDYLPKPK